MTSGPAAWSGLASTYDSEADHGLTRDDVRAVWRRHLRSWLPAAPSDIVDLGCGTGSLALLAAEDGHRVTGVDFADAMLERAREKAADAGLEIRFLSGDAGSPPLLTQTFDVVLVRHVLWALADPEAAVRTWSTLLRPAGRFVLVEGSWSTGAGLSAREVTDLLAPYATQVTTEPLTDPALWGAEIDDHRYVVRATVPPT